MFKYLDANLKVSMYTYSKSIVTDFKALFDPTDFGTRIVNNPGITTLYIDTTILGNNVSISFNVQLSAPEEIILDQIISSYGLVVEVVQQEFLLSFGNNTVRNKNYESISMVIFPGSSFIVNPTKIKIVSYMESGGTNYDIRVYDSTNNKTIASLTGLTNIETVINDLGILSNIPVDEAIFEVQVRSPGRSNIFIRSGILYYG